MPNDTKRGRRRVLAVTAAIAGSVLAASGAPQDVPQDGDVIVTLGDSITDGCTYPQIIMQALKEAGKPVPTMVCAGVASDTAVLMLARLAKTVLVFKPKTVTFSAGTNDSLRDVKPEDYEKALREIVRQAKAEGAAMILLTPCVISPARHGDEAARKASAAKAEAAEKVGAQYTDVIRKVAAEEGFAVAENNALMRKARAEGKEVMSEDGIHPNYLGQSLMARAILDAMGHKDVPLPAEFQPPLFPGVLPEWKMRLAPLGDDKKPMALTEQNIATLVPDAAWKTYTLPDAVPDNKPSAEDWLEQERRNGFAMQIEKLVGKGPVQAVATIDAKETRQVFLNTGIGVSTLWLNGKKIHEQGSAWTGFHAGKERIPVELKKGTNTIVCEISGQQFFLSVTDKLIWEAEIRK